MGGRRLGEAIEIAEALIEDRRTTPSPAYRPLVILVSDGVPTDSWESKLDRFINDGRSAKCDRMALGIGREAYSGAGRATLERFVAGTEHEVFEAKDAGEIAKFFRFVTMSVVTRSLSQNPNAVPKDSTLQPPQTLVEPAASARPRLHHRRRRQLLVVRTLWLVCDTSGSMLEAERLIVRCLVREVEQYIRLGYGAKADFKLVAWKDDAKSIAWSPGDEVPLERLDCRNSADGTVLEQPLGEQGDDDFIFTDGFWTDESRVAIKRWSERLAQDVRIIKIGADANPRAQGLRCVWS